MSIEFIPRSRLLVAGAVASMVALTLATTTASARSHGGISSNLAAGETLTAAYTCAIL